VESSFCINKQKQRQYLSFTAGQVFTNILNKGINKTQHNTCHKTSDRSPDFYQYKLLWLPACIWDPVSMWNRSSIRICQNHQFSVY